MTLKMLHWKIHTSSLEFKQSNTRPPASCWIVSTLVSRYGFFNVTFLKSLDYLNTLYFVCNYMVLLQCRESGEDALANAVWVLRDWGQYQPEPRRRSRRGRVVLPPISKDEDSIGQCVRARLTVLTLLLCKLEATKWKIKTLISCKLVNIG